MREIKFRAWDKLKKKMQEVAGVNFVEGVVMLWKTTGSVRSTYYVELSSIELQQFTGLLDKNGKEIYEGDILKAPMGMFVVEWRGAGLWEEEIGIKVGFGGRMTNDTWATEVIGNIYENPGLIKP